MFRFFWQVGRVGRGKVVKRRGIGRCSSDPAASCLGTNQNTMVTLGRQAQDWDQL